MWTFAQYIWQAFKFFLSIDDVKSFFTKERIETDQIEFKSFIQQEIGKKKVLMLFEHSSADRTNEWTYQNISFRH